MNQIIDQPTALTDLFPRDTNGPQLTDIGRRLILEKKNLNNLNSQAEEQSKLVRNLEESFFDAAMESGVRKIEIDGVLIHNPKLAYKASVSQMENEGFEFLRQNLLGDLIKLTVNFQSLSSAINQMIADKMIVPFTNPETGETVYLYAYDTGLPITGEIISDNTTVIDTIYYFECSTDEKGNKTPVRQLYPVPGLSIWFKKEVGIRGLKSYSQEKE